MGEDCKVAIRNIRRTANEDIKKQKKDNVLTEDDVKDAEKAVQDITDKFIKTAETITSAKEKEIMKV
jgi:ribosome recycling factor